MATHTILSKLVNEEIYNRLGCCLAMLTEVPHDQLYATAIVLRCHGNDLYACMVEDVIRWQRMLSPDHMVIDHNTRKRGPRERL